MERTAQEFTARRLEITGNVYHGAGGEISPQLLAFMSDLNHLGYHFEYHGPDTEVPGLARIWRSGTDNPLDVVKRSHS